VISHSKNDFLTPRVTWRNFPALACTSNFCTSESLRKIGCFWFCWFGITVAKQSSSNEGDFFVIKRHLAVTLSVIITAVSFLPATAIAQSTTEIEKVRATVQTLSVSKDSQVEVKFRDRTKIKGYIGSVEPLSFTLRDPKDGTSQSITYSEVDSVSKAGGGISTKTWLILGGVAAGVVTTWLVVKPAVCDGGAQTRGIC
jgi:hypothetical protein